MVFLQRVVPLRMKWACSSNPYRVLSLWWSNDIHLHRPRSRRCQFIRHAWSCYLPTRRKSIYPCGHLILWREVSEQSSHEMELFTLTVDSDYGHTFSEHSVHKSQTCSVRQSAGVLCHFPLGNAMTSSTSTTESVLKVRVASGKPSCSNGLDAVHRMCGPRKRTGRRTTGPECRLTFVRHRSGSTGQLTEWLSSRLHLLVTHETTEGHLPPLRELARAIDT